MLIRNNLTIFLFSIIFVTNVYSVNLNIIKNISDDNGTTTTKIISNIKGPTNQIINDALKKAGIYINKIPQADIKTNEKLYFIAKTALQISAAVALFSVAALAIKKIFFDKKDTLQIEAQDQENTNYAQQESDFQEQEPVKDKISVQSKEINSDIDKIIDQAEIATQKLFYGQQQDWDKKFQLFAERKKWALWPTEMSFLKMIEIPLDILLERLIDDIKSTYKEGENLNSNKAIENFIKDIENELADYKRKYNIILIGNIDRKDECLTKIKDNIKKLIYLKNSILTWANKNLDK